MIRTSVVSRRIYQLLHDLCQPYHLPGLWKDLPADDDVRAGPLDLAGVVARLAEYFTPDELVLAGVVRKTVEGGLVPAPALSAGGPLVFLRPHPERLPVEVLTSTGSLCGRRVPVVAAFSDWRSVQGLTTWDRHLLVASTLEDVAVLRSLGFAATLSTGLESLDARKLALLCPHFGWRQRTLPKDAPPGFPAPAPAPTEDTEVGTADEAPASHSHGAGAKARPRGGQTKPACDGKNVTEKYKAWLASLEAKEPDLVDPTVILLIGWSPSKLLLEKPAPLDAIVAQLRAIHKHLDMENMEIGLWVPGKVYLERLQFQLRLAPRRVSADEMFDELQESCGDPLFDSPETSAPHSPPANYLEAQQEYQDALRAFFQGQGGKGGKERLQLAREQLDRRLEQEVLAPLLMSGASPRTRNLQGVLLHASRLVHHQGLIVDETLCKGAPIPLDQVRQFSNLVQDVIALSKELRS